MGGWNYELGSWLAAGAHALGMSLAKIRPGIVYGVLAVSLLGWALSWRRARQALRLHDAAQREAAAWQERYEREKAWRTASTEAPARLRAPSGEDVSGGR